MFGIVIEKKGWQTVRMPLILALMIEGAGFAKVQQAGNAEECFQLRLTGAGREWLRNEETKQGH